MGRASILKAVFSLGVREGGIHSPHEKRGPMADILVLNLLPFLENDSIMSRLAYPDQLSSPLLCPT
ncbi:hypothetical protein U9M48_013474 [Paspalum notatum var. saurae]|uniref:Uncharacterized protein n=1 Tax=Paspalum notatum var. saurae TaxID=547442 RepID=A0AAQ3T2B5_PASNO